jgi:hypothetical protein
MLYEVSTRICAWILKVVRYIGSELYDAPIFDGIGLVDTFIEKMEKYFPEYCKVQEIDAIV